MEAVHKPSQRTWIDDKVINVKQFLEEWMEALTYDKDMSLKSKVTEEEYDEIERQCGLEAMRCEYQGEVEPSKNLTVPKGVNLKTLQLQAEDLKMRAENPKYNSAVYYSLKYNNYPPHKILTSLNDVSKIPYAPVATPEVILSVQFFVPERKLDTKVIVGYSKLPSFQLDQEFLVLGCQSLCELRDKIECVSDNAIPGEHSEDPSLLPSYTCKDIYKSGFFYINGTFYNDMRDHNCRDYSETIMKWAESGRRGIGPFKKAKMEETRFIDLDIQLGYPYVYVHQGNCEHLMVFSDLRVFSKHDFDNKNAYPLYAQVKATKRTFCMVCHVYTASWVVYDNKRVPENPYFFCKCCYMDFNYSETDDRIGEFKAYHYPDRSKMV